MSKNEMSALLTEIVNVEELEEKLAPSGSLGIDGLARA
jgi:hypothetical protein